jgi:hypothetical protein
MKNPKLMMAFLMVPLLAMSQLAFADAFGKSMGRIFSASAFVQSPGPEPGPASAVVAEVPEGSTFLLTQYCTPGGPFGPAPFLFGSKFGPVPFEPPCTTFTPGILFEGGQVLNCYLEYALPEGSACMVTGYMRPSGHDD